MLQYKEREIVKKEKLLFSPEIENVRHEHDYSFREHSSMGVGGIAKTAFFPKKISELCAVVSRLKELDIPYRVLGNTTNSLPCEGESGKVAIFTTDMTSVQVDGDRVFALAGTTTSSLLDVCERYGKSGVEFLEGIPATVGGATFMNAGACGKRIDGAIEKVLVYKDGKIREMQKKDCDFSYKHSVFMQEETIILGATFLLETCDEEDVAKNRQYYRDLRKKLPVGKSLGCIFKNPQGEGQKSAGQLIEGAGLKGLRRGGAFVSREHANFIINQGDATTDDILSLINLIKSAVFSQYGVRLEEEIRYLD